MEIIYLGRNVGTLRPDRKFISHRTEEHIFRKFNGLGMSYSVLMKLRKMDCRKIVLLLHRGETTTKYEAKISDFLENGIYWYDREDNQRILSFEFFEQKELTQVIQ